MLKTIDTYETKERLVTLKCDDEDNTYSVNLLTRDGKSIGKVYKSRFYARIQFTDFKNYPLEVLNL